MRYFKVLEAALKMKEGDLKKMQEEAGELLKLVKEKEERIVDLEFELLSTNQDRSLKSMDDADQYEERLRAKNEEIVKLKAELTKRTSDLQGLVNNELWQKNREIEKLQRNRTSKLIATKDEEIQKLQENLNTKQQQLDVLKTKISQVGVEFDDVRDLQDELSKSERLRLETNELVAVLIKRLEESAGFLEFLLKQKTVLGLLGSKENKRLRHLIEQSFDLSRSFTISMMVDPDQSLKQLTNISSFLNDDDVNDSNETRLSLIPADLTLTYHSHLHKKCENKDVVETLRQQIVDLKQELRLRDVELNKIGTAQVSEMSSEKEQKLNTTTSTLKCDDQSESEAWSEPDRSVSRARIGLNRGGGGKKCLTDSTEDEAGVGIKVTPKKTLLSESRQTIVELHGRVCELEKQLQDRETKCQNLTEANWKLSQEIELKLREAEARCVEFEIKVAMAKNTVDELEAEKRSLLDQIRGKDKELQNRVNQLEKEKVKALFEVKEREMDLETLRKDMENMEQSFRSEYEKQLNEAVENLEQECVEKIHSIQSEAETEIKELQKTIEQLQIDCSVNYVKKMDVETALIETDRLAGVVAELEEKIEELTYDEKQSREKLAEYEEKFNALRSDLDDATLQYSEAVLDKTRLANEKAGLEQEIGRASLREVDMKRQLDEVSVKFLGFSSSLCSDPFFFCITDLTF